MPAARSLRRHSGFATEPPRRDVRSWVWHRGGVTAPLAGIEALLVDLDGVLYVDDEPVTGAREAACAPPAWR